MTIEELDKEIDKQIDYVIESENLENWSRLRRDLSYLNHLTLERGKQLLEERRKELNNERND